MTRTPPPEVREFIEALRKFTRPTLRGWLRRTWMWLFPPRPVYATDGIKIGDVFFVNNEPRHVVSKTGSTVTLDNDMVVTLS